MNSHMVLLIMGLTAIAILGILALIWVIFRVRDDILKCSPRIGTIKLVRDLTDKENYMFLEIENEQEFLHSREGVFKIVKIAQK